MNPSVKPDPPTWLVAGWLGCVILFLSGAGFATVAAIHFVIKFW
jgi:hypothetical protein